METKVREYEQYLETHPQVKDIVTGYVSEVLKTQPDDVFSFTKTHFSKLREKDIKHPPLVIVGPSGVGKGTLIGRLMKEFSSHLGFSVSHTTRKPREGEIHGIHYHFASHEEVRNGVSQGHFIEYAEVHGNIYGTSFAAVAQVQDSGRICILDIDVQGMESVKRTDLKPRTIFVAPPSHEELEKRLRGRGTETEESIQRRLANAHKELMHLSQPGAVHHTIVNDDLEQAYQQLRNIILEWYPHLKGE